MSALTAHRVSDDAIGACTAANRFAKSAMDRTDLLLTGDNRAAVVALRVATAAVSMAVAATAALDLAVEAEFGPDLEDEDTELVDSYATPTLQKRLERLTEQVAARWPYDGTD